MAKMDDLIHNFKNLGGNTVGEHKRNFNLFCRKLDGLSEDEVNILLTSLHPNNLQENIFYVHLLARYKRTKELYDIFYQNNIALNKIILRIYTRGFLQDLQASEFINEVCPKISYSMRLMIINKLSQQITDSKIADDFFKAILNKYGIKFAEKLLVNCSVELIEETLEIYKVHFKNRALIKLHKKSSDLLVKYVKKNLKYYDSEMLLRYLAINDVHTFHKVLEQNTDFLGNCRINLKGFINFINNYREFYIKEARHFYNLLPDSSWTYKYLSKDEFALFLKNLCENQRYQSFVFLIEPFIKSIPTNVRGSIIFENYKQIYDKEIWEKDELASYDLYSLLPLISLEERLKFPIKIKTHLEYWDPKEAFEYVKQNINFTQDINTRQDFLLKIISNCKLNKDFETLLEVLKYFCKRHKNDVLHVRQHFLNNVLENFNKNLTEEHWKYINELMLNIKAKDEIFLHEHTYLVTYIQYKIANEMDYTEDLKNFLKFKMFGNSWRLLKEYPRWERTCILNMRDLIEECFPEKKDLLQAKITFLKTLGEWNDEHRKDLFDLYAYPDCIEALMSAVIKDTKIRYSDEIFVKVLLNKNPEHFHKRDVYIENYLRDCEKMLPDKLLPWLQRHKPDILQKYLQKFLDNCSFGFSFYEISKMHWNGLSDQLKNYAVDVLDNENKAEIHKVLQALRILSYEEEFLNYIKRYIPEEDCVIDVYKSEVKNHLRIQREILELLKNSCVPNKNLEVNMKFCAGDYLQYALEPLYFILNNTPEEDLSGPLRTLSNRSVSVRKHAAFLTAKLSPKEFVYELFRDMCEAEKNASARKYLLKTIFSYFCENYNDALFDLFKDQLCLVPKEDNESWDVFFNWNRIPVKYLSEYVIFVWNHAKKLELDSKYKLLEAFNEEIFKTMSDDFCKEIIDSCLFKVDTIHNYSMENFVYNYLKFGRVSVDDRVSYIIEKVLDFKSTLLAYEDYNKGYESIQFLISRICSCFIKEKSKISDLKLVSSILLNEFEKGPFGVEFTEIKVFLHLTDSFLQLPTENLESLCKIIVDIHEILAEKFGTQIFYMYSKVVKNFINHISQKSGDDLFVYNFLELLNQNFASTQIKLISLWLLPNHGETSEEKKLKSKIINLIQLNSDPVVEVYAHMFRLNNLSSF